MTKREQVLKTSRMAIANIRHGSLIREIAKQRRIELTFKLLRESSVAN